MNGAECLVKTLEELEVEHVFGHPGGAILPVYDAVYNSSIKHMLFRHEQGAAHAADGFARATGKPGVCMATSGPGATNLVTGLATAMMDSIPIVAFTGQVPTHLIGTDAFQESDVVGITTPVTKYNYQIRDPAQIELIVREAFKIATTGRPGPVLVDLPKDVMNVDIPAQVRGENLVRPSLQAAPEPDEQVIQQCVEALAAAERPVIFAGGGIVSGNATAALKRVAEAVDAAITSTLTGIGAYPGTADRFYGMVGMHGTYAANQAVQAADTVITIGMRFDDRATGKPDTFAPDATLIHVDVDASEFNKNIPVDLTVHGDAREVLSAIAGELESGSSRSHPTWHHQLQRWQQEHPVDYEPSATEIRPQTVVEELYRLTGGEAVLTTGVGQHQMWAALHYPVDEPRTFITSSGLGTMGYGLPAAIGAQIAHPDRRVICIDGDGSFQMTCQSLMTAVEYELPIITLILNNSYLGMVRQWQEIFYDNRLSGSDLHTSPNYVQLAESFGAHGLRMTKPQQIKGVLKEALTTPGPVVVDCRVSAEENVYPMVPNGAALHEMIERPRTRQLEVGGD